MANTLLTINMITREAVRLFLNTNAFIGNINKQYDDQFAKTGAKIGQTVRIRLPNDYTVTSGPAASVQDTAEQFTTLTVANQFHVDVSFSSVERTMSLDDYSEIILAPMINNLVGAVALNIMSGSEGGICNLSGNFDSGGAVLSPTSDTWLNAGANLSANSAQVTDRKIVADPFTMARTVGSLTGLFNPQSDISRQYKTAKMYDALNFIWFEDQTVLQHTTGSFSAGGAVSSAGVNNVSSIPVSAITGTFNIGDIVAIDGVYGVNRVTKQSFGQLRQFVVTANVATGATSIPVYPALVAPVAGQNVQYQTVNSTPANGAQVRLLTAAGSVYRKNIAYSRDAVTMATADLVMPKNLQESARENKDGISIRMLSQYAIGTDQEITRCDVLFGSTWVRPEWAVVVPDRA